MGGKGLKQALYRVSMTILTHVVINMVLINLTSQNGSSYKVISKIYEKIKVL